MKIKCMIVEDETLAQEVLERYILKLPSLNLVKKCSDALEAIDYLMTNSVDLIFLDINMPDLTGIEFLKTLNDPPKVIITTAFPEYALEGYEYSVIDYLVKPISFERFVKAVNKIPLINENLVESPDRINEDFIFVKENKIHHKILYSEIRYIEGCGNFINIVTEDKTIMVLERMKNIQSKLSEDLFIRVHKSYIVSARKIEQIEGNMIRIGLKTIPISKHYKLNTDKIINKYNIKP